MKVSEILNLNMNDKGSMKLLRMAIVEKIPFFKDEDAKTLTTSHLEKLILKMQIKYPVRIAYIMPGPVNDKNQEFYYSLMMKRTDNHEWVKTVYGISLFEVYAKATLFLYGYIKATFRKDE